jgi:hypothetical protein
MKIKIVGVALGHMGVAGHPHLAWEWFGHPLGKNLIFLFSLWPLGVAKSPSRAMSHP